MTPTLPKAQTHAERLRMLVDEGFAPVRDHAAIMAGAEALAEVQRLREALIKVRAHTSYANPTMELLAGLLQSIERITDAALLETP